MQFPIFVGLRRSRILDVSVALISLLASATVFVLPVPDTVQLGTLLAILAQSLLAFRELKPVLVSIRLDQGGAISIRDCASEGYSPATLLKEQFAHPYLLSFRLISEAGIQYRLLLTVDSTNRSDFRRLRVALRSRSNSASTPADA